MSKKVLIAVIVVAVIASLLFVAHRTDFIDILKRMHGG